MNRLLQLIKYTLAPWLCDPTDLVGCIFWLRASLGVEVADAAGHVKSWTDQVAHLPLTPASQANAPVYLKWVPTLNDKPGIAYYHDTAMLRRVGGVPLPWDEAPFSLFAMCAPENAHEVNSVVAMWAGTVPHAGLAFLTTGELRGFLEEDFASNTKPDAYRPHVVGMTYNGLGTLKLYVDGKQVASHGGLFVSAQDGGDASVLAVGGHTNGAEGFRGHLGEVVVYNRALDDDDVRFLTGAINAHYSPFGSWYQLLINRVAGAARALAGLVGGELRHLFGAGGDTRSES